MILKAFQLIKAIQIGKDLLTNSPSKGITLHLVKNHVYIISEFKEMKCVSKLENLFPFEQDVSFQVNILELDSIIPSFLKGEILFEMDETSIGLASGKQISVKRIDSVLLPIKNYQWLRQRDKWGFLHQCKNAVNEANEHHSLYLHFYSSLISLYHHGCDYQFILPDKLKLDYHFSLSTMNLEVLLRHIPSNDFYVFFKYNCLYVDYSIHSFYIQHKEVRIPKVSKEEVFELTEQVVGC